MPLGLPMKTVAFAFVFAALVTPTTNAGIIGTTGSLGQITPPAYVDLTNPPNSNTDSYIFHERSTTLTSSLAVDASGPGNYNSKSDLDAGMIASGTRVDSYLLFSDPKKGQHIYSGTVTFDTVILGVEVLTKSLNATDSALGHVGTSYYTGVDRGLEFKTDSFTITVSNKTLTYYFVTSGVLDEIRIVTAVPEPASLAMSGTALLAVTGLALRRRKARITQA